MARHKFADVIIAWAEGKEIQFKVGDHNEWADFDEPAHSAPSFGSSIYQWRIKPEKKVGWINIYSMVPFIGGICSTKEMADDCRQAGGRKDAVACIRIEYTDGEGL